MLISRWLLMLCSFVFNLRQNKCYAVSLRTHNDSSSVEGHAFQKVNVTCERCDWQPIFYTLVLLAPSCLGFPNVLRPAACWDSEPYHPSSFFKKVWLWDGKVHCWLERSFLLEKSVILSVKKYQQTKQLAIPERWLGLLWSLLPPVSELRVSSSERKISSRERWEKPACVKPTVDVQICVCMCEGHSGMVVWLCFQMGSEPFFL